MKQRSSTLLILLCMAGLWAFAQKPGGVSLDMELWLCADNAQDVLPGDSSTLSLWMDRSGNGINFGTNGAHLVPKYIYGGRNFNPRLSFTGGTMKLVSVVDFPKSNTKAYYAFWVSEVSGTARNIVFGYYPSGETDGWYQGKLYVSTAGNSTQHVGINKSYGIGVTLRANGGKAGRLLHNGVETVLPTTSMNTNFGKAVVGSYNATATSSTYQLTGSVSEIIIFSAPAGVMISDADLAKVHTYLSLKYDIPFTSALDWINKDGVVVWDKSWGSYQNNVFGIARDDASRMNIRQSHSEADSSFTVFVGDTVAALNVLNKGALPDRAYILFGSNGEKGEETYIYPSGTDFLNVKTDTEISHCSKRVWRVQNTNVPTNTAVHIRSKGLYVMVSPSETFTPAQTRLYKITNGTARNVLLTNGEYIRIASFQRAPGGVTNGLRLWLMANEGGSVITGGATDQVDAWKDISGFGHDYTFADVAYSGKKRPTFIACDDRMNYHPTLNFELDAFLARKEGPMSVDAPDDLTTFVVYRSDDQASSGDRLYTHGFGGVNPVDIASRYPAMGFSPSNKGGVGRIYGVGGAEDVNGNIPGYKEKTTALHVIHTRKAAAVGGRLAEHEFGGWSDVIKNPGGTAFGNNFRLASGGTLGGASLAVSRFSGLISEVFYYESDLSTTEREQVKTYLAMKYGITLDADFSSETINADYILSDKTIVWEGNNVARPENRYHHNVVGLVRDDISKLLINKAKSSADGAIITMTVPKHKGCGQGSAAELVNNHSAVYWGNNRLLGADVSLAGSKSGQVEFKLRRTWLARKTHLPDQAVEIRIGNSSDFDKSTAGYQLYLLFADSQADADANRWTQIVPTTFSEGEHVASFTLKDEYSYFTVGYRQLPVACPTCPTTKEAVLINQMTCREL